MLAHERVRLTISSPTMVRSLSLDISISAVPPALQPIPVRLVGPAVVVVQDRAMAVALAPLDPVMGMRQIADRVTADR